MKILPSLLRFVQLTSVKYNIDESHAVGHSMEVLHNTHEIFINNIFTPLKI